MAWQPAPHARPFTISGKCTEALRPGIPPRIADDPHGGFTTLLHYSAVTLISIPWLETNTIHFNMLKKYRVRIVTILVRIGSKYGKQTRKFDRFIWVVDRDDYTEISIVPWTSCVTAMIDVCHDDPTSSRYERLRKAHLWPCWVIPWVAGWPLKPWRPAGPVQFSFGKQIWGKMWV